MMEKHDIPRMTKAGKARIELIGSYAEAAGNLYCVLSLSEFVDVFNHYESEKTDKREAVSVLQQIIDYQPEMTTFSLYMERSYDNQ